MAPKKKKQLKKGKRKVPRSLRVKKQKNLPKTLQQPYRVTYDPIEGEPLPEEVENQKEELHDLLLVNPKEAILLLKPLKEKYSDVPLLYNWLSAAFSANGQEEVAESIAKENYEKNPYYLFAKLNYAEFCLKRGEFDEVSRIMEGKFDLKLLYPERDTFHITEAVGFMSIAGKYFIAKEMIESAQICYQALMEIAPDHPSTNQLMLLLAPSALKALALMK
ncbi:MAG: hypothetical protein D3923_04195 [Candidatus Electrothrix sp. AR3]|nr:hypothetical protein [Candidatus Electrothrix sp. AR3]